MPDLLKQGSAWLDRQMRNFAASRVDYTRDAASERLPATIGRTVFDLEDGSGAITRVESRDYLIDVSDLKLDSIPVEPAHGDRIIDGEHTYEVVPFGSEPAWRYSDLYRKKYRIHTKLIENPT